MCPYYLSSVASLENNQPLLMSSHHLIRVKKNNKKKANFFETYKETLLCVNFIIVLGVYDLFVQDFNFLLSVECKVFFQVLFFYLVTSDVQLCVTFSLRLNCCFWFIWFCLSSVVNNNIGEFLVSMAFSLACHATTCPQLELGCCALYGKRPVEHWNVVFSFSFSSMSFHSLLFSPGILLFDIIIARKRRRRKKLENGPRDLGLGRPPCFIWRLLPCGFLFYKSGLIKRKSGTFHCPSARFHLVQSSHHLLTISLVTSTFYFLFFKRIPPRTKLFLFFDIFFQTGSDVTC